MIETEVFALLRYYAPLVGTVIPRLTSDPANDFFG